MALEGDALFFNFPTMGERINLKPTTIGQHGALPAIETVDATRSLQHIQAGAQVEVIGIAQADLGVDIVSKFVLVYGFYRSRCAHGHKNRGMDRAVVGLDLSGAGAGVGVGMEELEGQG